MKNGTDKGYEQNDNGDGSMMNKGIMMMKDGMLKDGVMMVR